MKLLHYKAKAKCIDHISLFINKIFELPLIDLNYTDYNLYAAQLIDLKYHKKQSKVLELEFEFKTYLTLKQLINIVEAIEDNYLMYRTMYQLTNASGKGFYCFPKNIFYEVIYGEEE